MKRDEWDGPEPAPWGVWLAINAIRRVRPLPDDDISLADDLRATLADFADTQEGLLAEWDRLHEFAENLSLQYDEACSDRNRRRDERDELLAKLGVVSEACRKVVEMGEPHDPAAEVEICAAALASEPEIVAVVRVMGFYADEDGHILHVEYPRGYRAGANDRAIIVRRAE